MNRCRAFSWEVISLAQRQGHAILVVILVIVISHAFMGDVVTYTISLTHLKRDTSDLRLAVSERSEPGSRGAWDKGWGQYA